MRRTFVVWGENQFDFGGDKNNIFSNSLEKIFQIISAILSRGCSGGLSSSTNQQNDYFLENPVKGNLFPQEIQLFSTIRNRQVLLRGK